MSNSVVDVKYQYFYDFTYRVRNARLESTVYKVDFMDWIKAGIAYNTRSELDSSRKILNFIECYEAIISDKRDTKSDLLISKAVTNFYEDLFQLYQEHILSQLKIRYRRSANKIIEPELLEIIPTFLEYKERLDFLETKEIDVSNYVCSDKDGLKKKMSTIYVKDGSIIFQYMSLYFDFGIKFRDKSVLLEVKRDAK